MSIIDRLRDKLARRMTVKILSRFNISPFVTESEFYDAYINRKYTVRLLVYPGPHNTGRPRIYGIDEWLMASDLSSYIHFRGFLADQVSYSRRLRRNNLLLTRSNLWQWLK